MISSSDLEKTEQLARGAIAARIHSTMTKEEHDYSEHMNEERTLQMVEEIKRLRKEVLDWKGTHAHQCTESSIRIGGLEQSLQRANEELKNLREWNSDLEEQNGRVAIKNQLLEGKIARARGLLEECEKALEWEDRRCGKVFGPLGEALAKLRASRGEK